MRDATAGQAAITLPPGRSGSMASFLLNNATYNVKDFGARGDGVADDFAAIMLADAAAAAAGGDVYFPVGTYKHTQNLVVGRRWYGVPIKSVLRPTNAVTKCVDLISDTVHQTNGMLDGMYLEGVDTTGKVGIFAGTALTNLTSVRNCQVWRFGGAGARGIEITQLVTGTFENVYVCQCYVGLHTNGGNTPTDTAFINCQFREATTKGVWLETGYGMRFTKCLFESNQEEGVYMKNVGGTLIDTAFRDCWYENNWLSLAAGAARHAAYHFFCDGANGPGGTIGYSQENGIFTGTANGARALHLTNCIAFRDINARLDNEAGQVLVDGNSYGVVELNGQSSFLTVVTQTTPGNTVSLTSAIVDGVQGAWASWVPVVTAGGAMTVSALVITKARYHRVGKTVDVQLNIGFTLGGTASGLILVTLPPGLRSLDANQYGGAWLTDGAYTDGYVRADGTNPNSGLMIARKDSANFGLGAGKAVSLAYTFELF